MYAAILAILRTAGQPIPPEAAMSQTYFGIGAAIAVIVFLASIGANYAAHVLGY